MNKFWIPEFVCKSLFKQKILVKVRVQLYLFIPTYREEVMGGSTFVS